MLFSAWLGATDPPPPRFVSHPGSVPEYVAYTWNWSLTRTRLLNVNALNAPPCESFDVGFTQQMLYGPPDAAPCAVLANGYSSHEVLPRAASAGGATLPPHAIW